MTRSALDSPLPTGATAWLSRAVVVSLLAHLVLLVVVVKWLHRDEQHDVELVDIEVAPPPPVAEALPAEVARQIEQAAEDKAKEAAAAAAASAPEQKEPGEGAENAAGVDAPPDAAPDAAPPDAALVAKKKRADAGVDAEQGAVVSDAGMDAEAVATAGSGSDSGSGSGTGMGTDAGTGVEVATGSGSGNSNDLGFGAGSSLGSGSAGSGSPAAIATSAGRGVAGMDDQPAVEGAQTSAGTAANLLAYFPVGHTLSVLVRFDRLRGSEWAKAAEDVFRPMPDYQGLFGSRTADIATKLDMLVISTPRPRDATATTLVMKTSLPRSSVRDLLANTSAPIAWSAVRGGALGKRSGKVFQNDKRVVLSPWQGWYVLAQPEDLGPLTAAASGNVDRIEAKGKLPGWLAGLRSIEKESGEKSGEGPETATAPGAGYPATDAKKGPALVLTVGEPPRTTAPAKSGRYKLPELGLGVRSLPVPSRISLAMELVKQGWLVRGNIVFANEADATELVTTLTGLQTRITDSHILSAVLRKQHVLNVVTGLSLSRSGARVSYATSISIADARAILTAAAIELGGYFGQTP